MRQFIDHVVFQLPEQDLPADCQQQYDGSRNQDSRQHGCPLGHSGMLFSFRLAVFSAGRRLRCGRFGRFRRCRRNGRGGGGRGLLFLRQREQRLLHFFRGLIAVPGIIAAGFQDDPGHFGGGVDRRLQRFSRYAACQGFPLRGGGVQGRLREEGQAVVVQQPVEGQAQGIDIRPGVVGACLGRLRGDIVGRSLCAHARRAAFQGAGDAEIAELIKHVRAEPVVHKDVFGFDVAVDQVFALAQNQRGAQINADPGHFLLGELFVADIIVQRGKQLHPDEDIAADAVFPGFDLVILNTDDIRHALEEFHDLDFPDEFLHGFGEKAPGLVGGEAL